jgi:aldehyde dehydrogenase (NAD+)
MNPKSILKKLGLKLDDYKGKDLEVFSPIDGDKIADLKCDNAHTLEEKITKSIAAFHAWRDVPAPKRGELIRVFGNELRKHKELLASLITIECGKIKQESLGEVQEMIDICDFAVGLSRQIGGLTLPSERPNHVMYENWQPLGVIGVISAFNFPAAVWAWNFALAITCGDPVIWKPSEKTPLTALACQTIFDGAVKIFGEDTPENLSQIIIGKADLGKLFTSDKRIPLISATGSCRMGEAVAETVAKRLGRSLLELGGNNAIIVTPSADLNVALPSILFGAVGTAGQRCTTTRRLFVHRSIYDALFERLREAYDSLGGKVGNPEDTKTLIGPLIDKHSFEQMTEALNIAHSQDGEVCGGHRVLAKKYKNAYYVHPALVKLRHQTTIVKRETFAPILYVMPYDTLEDAIYMQNDVAQGLSSAIFTNDLREAEIFKKYSDCGIANVNIGTSGAEIGGAFGGEKETGGGRESGSDSWKNYMRRQTSTTYYGDKTPELAQGVVFG